MGSHTSITRDDATDVDVRTVMDPLRRIVQALRSPATLAKTTGRAGRKLSAAQLFVLSRLATADALSINALAAATATHQSSVSVVVAKLVDAGLLRRERSVTDGRIALVAITPRGRTVLRGAPAAPQDALIAGLRSLSARERTQLATLLSKWSGAAGHSTRLPPPMFFEPTIATRSPIRPSAVRPSTNRPTKAAAR